MDLSFMSDMELVQMQNELRDHPEDKDMLHKVLKELHLRQKHHNNKDKENAGKN